LQHLRAGATAAQANERVRAEFGKGLSRKWLSGEKKRLLRMEGRNKQAERKAMATALLLKGVSHEQIHHRVKKKFGVGYDMSKLVTLREELGLPAGSAKGRKHGASAESPPRQLPFPAASHHPVAPPQVEEPGDLELFLDVVRKLKSVFTAEEREVLGKAVAFLKEMS
jgi:transposase